MLVASPNAIELANDETYLAWAGDNTGSFTDGPIFSYDSDTGDLNFFIAYEDVKWYSLAISFDDTYIYVGGQDRTLGVGVTARVDVETMQIDWSAYWGLYGRYDGYFANIDAILEDEWGGGDFVGVMPWNLGPDPTYIDMIKLEIHWNGSNYVGYLWAGFGLSCDGNCTNYGDPVSLYVKSTQMHYLCFATRSRTGIVSYNVNDDTLYSVYEIAVTDAQVYPRQISYSEASALIYIFVQRDDVSLIYAIIEDSYPELKFATEVSSSKVSEFWAMSIVDDYMFLGG